MELQLALGSHNMLWYSHPLWSRSSDARYERTRKIPPRSRHQFPIMSQDGRQTHMPSRARIRIVIMFTRGFWDGWYLSESTNWLILEKEVSGRVGAADPP